MPSKCKGCNKPAVTKRGWCSRPCYQKNQSKVGGTNRGWFSMGERVERIISTCVVCGDDIRDRYHRKFCTTACANEYRIQRPTNGNPKPTHDCSNCGSLVKKHLGPTGHVYCSRVCYDEFRASNKVPTKIRVSKIEKVCEICNASFYVYPCRENTAKYCSKSCLGVAGNLSQGSGNRSSIEFVMEHLLDKLGIEYEYQVPIKVGEYTTIVDFMVQPNIVLYCDGDYWHSLSEVRRRDSYFNKGLGNLGYTIFRFSEYDLNHNLHKIEQELCHL